MTLTVLFSAGAIACVLIAFGLWIETRRNARALPRMRVCRGIVRELESVLTDRNRGEVRSQTLVRVDFSVEGKTYCCRTLYLFCGNRHVGDVGKKFDLQPGQSVGLYYDPADPRRSALLLDKPRYDTVIIFLVAAVILAVFALVKAV